MTNQRSTQPLSSTSRSDRSDSGPVGFQIHDALGLTDDEQRDELWPATEAAIRGRGLDIRQRVDKGGYGVVFRARDTKTGQGRAIKVVLNPLSSTAVTSFRREWQVLDSRDLPGVSDQQPRVAPQFFFGDETEGAQPFLVQEWIAGQNLEDYVNSHPSLSMLQRESICGRVFCAYDSLHRANLLHRDVSIRNIMLQKGQIRLIDFGSACRKDAGYASKNSLSKVPIARGFASDSMAAGETRGSVAHEVHAIAKCCFFVLTGKMAHDVPAHQWQRTLIDAQVDRKLVVDVLLPRMQQPPEDR